MPFPSVNVYSASEVHYNNVPLGTVSKLVMAGFMYGNNLLRLSHAFTAASCIINYCYLKKSGSVFKPSKDAIRYKFNSHKQSVSFAVIT